MFPREGAARSTCPAHGFPEMRRHPKFRFPSCVLAILVGVLVHALCAQAAEKGTIDWERVARLKPDLKILALLESDSPLCLKDLAALADKGFKPADRDPGLLLGFKSAIFANTLDKWKGGRSLPPHFRGKLLKRFSMTGIYRVGFKVEAEGYAGPLEIKVTAPRDGFGRKLVYAEHVVRPACEKAMRVDAAGNRWLTVRFPETQYGRVIKFHFAFEYEVDMATLLKHALVLARKPASNDVPPDVQPFLRPGYKINPSLPSAVAWAVAGGSGPPDAKKEFKRLTEFVKRSVVYDNRKRAAYFGGKTVYPDVDLMYQDVGQTLARGKGCCPDTILLECAFLRARGVPCRTAGRFGHFFTLVYVPGNGWMSTSVTPTGIPLIVSPGPAHVPYQNWSPRIPLKTTRWEARVRIDTLED